MLRQIGQRYGQFLIGPDPDHFFYFGGGLDVAIDVCKKQFSVYGMTRLISGRRIEDAERRKVAGGQLQSEFFLQLSGHGLQRRFAARDLAAGQHEAGGAAFAYQQQGAVGAQQQGRGDMNDGHVE